MNREYAAKLGFNNLVEAWQNGHQLQSRRGKGSWNDCSLGYAIDCDDRDELRIKPKDHPSGIVIPSRPPPGVVEALRNFVEAIEEYDKSGVWPDNPTLRKLADEGRDALRCGHSPNDELKSGGQ